MINHYLQTNAPDQERSIMFEKDAVLKILFSDKAKFADLINGLVYDGKEVIQAEELEQLPGESVIFMDEKTKRHPPVYRYRDIVMRAKRGAKFVIFGIENETKIHYAMPVRKMCYDAMTYAGQIKNIERKHRSQKQKMEVSEFLSGMKKEDKLYPTVSFVLNFGENEWEGPVDLYSMLDTEAEEMKFLRKYMPNYWINVVNVRNIRNVGQFRTSLRELFALLKYASDLDGMERYLKMNRERCQQLDEDTFRALTVFLGEEERLKVYMENGERKAGDMCRAFDQLEERGFNRGKEEGIEQGIERGIEQGKKQGERRKMREIARNLLGMLEYEVIADTTGLSLEEVKEEAKLQSNTHFVRT